MSNEANTAMRQRLRTLLGGFPATPLRIMSRERLDLGWADVIAERLALSSDDGPVRAFVTGPARAWADRPAVLYIHAHGNRYGIGASELMEGRPTLQQPAYGRVLASAGLVVICIDLPCFGDRAEPGEAALSKRHHWQGRTLFGAMLADLAGTLELLRSEIGVDRKRLGTMGLSMGATLAFWLAALETDIAAVAHLCCFADLANLVDCGAHDLHGPYMTVPGLLPLISTGRIAGLVAPRPQLICLGSEDPLTPPRAVEIGRDDVSRCYATAGRPDRLGVFIEHGSGHTETSAMRQEVLSFLRRTLIGAADRP